jgi:hypothetical protein
MDLNLYNGSNILNGNNNYIKDYQYIFQRSKKRIIKSAGVAVGAVVGVVGVVLTILRLNAIN